MHMQRAGRIDLLTNLTGNPCQTRVAGRRSDRVPPNVDHYMHYIATSRTFAILFPLAWKAVSRAHWTGFEAEIIPANTRFLLLVASAPQ